MPGCYLPTDNEQPIAFENLTRADCGLPETGFVFGSFNQAYKIDVAMFALWMRLLAKVEGSVLWLLRANPAAQQNLQRAVTASDDRTVCAWDLGTGESIATFSTDAPVNCCAIARDAMPASTTGVQRGKRPMEASWSPKWPRGQMRLLRMRSRTCCSSV